MRNSWEHEHEDEDEAILIQNMPLAAEKKRREE